MKTLKNAQKLALYNPHTVCNVVGYVRVTAPSKATLYAMDTYGNCYQKKEFKHSTEFSKVGFKARQKKEHKYSTAFSNTDFKACLGIPDNAQFIGFYKAAI